MSTLALEAAFAGSPLPRTSLRRVARRIERRVGESTVQRLSLASAGHLYVREGEADRQQASDETLARSLLVRPGELVINPMWLIGGSVAVSDRDGAVSPDYRVFDLDTRVVGRYLHHVLRSDPYRRQYELFVRADTTFDRRIQQNDLDGMPLWLPAISEQRRIADFLDERVARIDQIIAARRMQDSSLALVSASSLQLRFDELSARFGETRLGRVLTRLEQGWSPQAESSPAQTGGWGVMRAGAVNGGTFNVEDNKSLPDGMEPRREYEIEPGDLLMSRASGSLDLIGSVAVVPKNVRPRLLLPDKLYRLSLAAGWEPDFVAPMLRVHANRDRIRLGVSGAEGMANNLPSGVIRGLHVPNAPTEAQREAIHGTNRAIEQSRGLRVHLAESIRLLQEYKQSLITAAVTGELDVTTASTRIPGE